MCNALYHFVAEFALCVHATLALNACSSRKGSQNKMDDWDDWGDSPSKPSSSNKGLPVSSRVGAACATTRNGYCMCTSATYLPGLSKAFSFEALPARQLVNRQALAPQSAHWCSACTLQMPVMVPVHRLRLVPFRACRTWVPLVLASTSNLL